jgi:hypothetical protein
VATAADAPEQPLPFSHKTHAGAADGYYRATRFDWSGVVASLEFQGHNYFGVWFPHYDPKLHDAITGPVEEYRTGDRGLGYADATRRKSASCNSRYSAAAWCLPPPSITTVSRESTFR